MERLWRVAPAIGIVIAVIGLAMYLVIGLIAVLGLNDTLHDTLMGNPAANVGIPCSALAAFVIVATLWKAFPPKGPDGQVELRFFGMAFSGPGGPIGLWVVCFLSLIFAVSLLRLDGPPAEANVEAAAE